MPQPASASAQPSGAAPRSADTVVPSDDVVADIEAAAARLDAELSDTMPLTELADRLTALHGQLQSALRELDRT